MEDGTYGVTLSLELFGEDHTNSAGGEEGFLGWGWGAGTPSSLILIMSPSILSVSGSVMEPSTHPVASPYAFLVAGGSLLLGIALFVGIMMR